MLNKRVFLLTTTTVKQNSSLMPIMSVGMGKTFSTFCLSELFVRNVTQKQMITKVFKLGMGNDVQIS